MGDSLIRRPLGPQRIDAVYYSVMHGVPGLQNKGEVMATERAALAWARAHPSPCSPFRRNRNHKPKLLP